MSYQDTTFILWDACASNSANSSVPNSKCAHNETFKRAEVAPDKGNCPYIWFHDILPMVFQYQMQTAWIQMEKQNANQAFLQ